MSKWKLEFRIICIVVLIAFYAGDARATESSAQRGQATPAAPKEERKNDSKKGEKTEAKNAAYVKVSVEIRSDGAPVADALVLVKQSGGFEMSSSTNSKGVARFPQVPRGKTTLQVTALGFKPYTAEKELTGSEVTLTIALSK